MNKQEGFFSNNEVALSDSAALKRRIYVEFCEDPSFLKYWEETGLPFSKIAKRNFKQMQRLEEKQPGICKVLNKQFNIFNFYKFPEAVLLKQFQLAERVDLPYGIIFASVNDVSSSEPESENYNDGFNNYQWHELLTNMRRQLGNDAALRIFECGSINDIRHSLESCLQKYSVRKKSDFMIISGHSNSEEIQLGKEDESQDNVLDCSNAVFFEQVKEAFSEKAIVILDACLAASSNDSLAEFIARYLQRRVIGITDVGSLKSLNILKKKGALEIKNINFSFSKAIKIVDPPQINA